MVLATFQVVNTGVQRALDEFVNNWVGKEVERLVGLHTWSSMQRVLEDAGQNLRVLVDQLADLIQHFVADSPVTVSFA